MPQQCKQRYVTCWTGSVIIIIHGLHFGLPDFLCVFKINLQMTFHTHSGRLFTSRLALHRNDLLSKWGFCKTFIRLSLTSYTGLCVSVCV